MVRVLALTLPSSPGSRTCSGSLWTSIMPCLSMRGVGGAIARSSSLRHKILLLNTSHDRETDGLDAIDFLK